jgi:hypothetical protein
MVSLAKVISLGLISIFVTCAVRSPRYKGDIVTQNKTEKTVLNAGENNSQTEKETLREGTKE